jgi:hypothetical protein
MPSDTVWVALVGGGVTVASLGVQGWLTRGAEKRRNEREDRLRREERDWSIRDQNLGDRRAVYGRLLRSAGELRPRLTALIVISPDTFDARPGVETTLRELSVAASEAEVHSVDEKVYHLAMEIRDEVQNLLDDNFWHSFTDDPKRQDEAFKAVKRIDYLVEVLRAACRRDLGLGADLIERVIQAALPDADSE